MTLVDVLEARQARCAWVSGTGWLLELLWVAYKHGIACSKRHGQAVGERELSGFIDNECVNRVAHRFVGEQEARAHNDIKLLCICRNLFCVFHTLASYFLLGKNKGGVAIFWFDTNTQWLVGGKAVIFSKLGDLAQQLVVSSVSVGRDANSVALFDQRENGIG